MSARSSSAAFRVFGEGKAAHGMVPFELLAEPSVRADDAFAQSDLRAPSQRRQTPDIEQLARRSLGSGGIEHDAAAIAHDIGDRFGELRDGEVRARSDIYGVGLGIA